MNHHIIYLGVLSSLLATLFHVFRGF